jgi:protein-S-isoprenylcysteine O-methyltransferase Ste14
MTQREWRRPGQRATSWTEKLVLAVGLCAAVALCTPLVGVAWVGQSWFGLPRALIWVVGWLVAVFLALVLAYWSEGRRGRSAVESHPSAGDSHS